MNKIDEFDIERTLADAEHSLLLVQDYRQRNPSDTRTKKWIKELEKDIKTNKKRLQKAQKATQKQAY